MPSSASTASTSTLLGRHLLALTKIEDGAQFFREHALKSVWKPVINFRIENGNEPLDYKTVSPTCSRSDFRNCFCHLQWSLLKAELPPQVNILTIEPVSQEGQVLTVVFRVEHFYERKEHSTLSKSVSLNIHVSAAVEILSPHLEDSVRVENLPATQGARSERSNAWREYEHIGSVRTAQMAGATDGWSVHRPLSTPFMHVLRCRRQAGAERRTTCLRRANDQLVAHANSIVHHQVGKALTA